MSRGNNGLILTNQYGILFPSTAGYMAEKIRTIWVLIYSTGCKKDLGSPGLFKAHIRHREETKARNGLRSLAKLQRQ